MESSNFVLYMWYLVPAIIGALIYKKNRVAGFFIGLVVAFITITLLAITIGG